jgi:hypothetical protein
MMKLDWIIDAWPGVAAHGLGVPRSRLERLRWGGRHIVGVGEYSPATSQFICRVVSTTRTQFLRLACTSEMSRSILEYSSNFVRLALVCSLPSNTKGFLHEFIQSLHGVIELCRRFSEVFHVEIARIGSEVSLSIPMLEVRRRGGIPDSE